MKNKKNETFLKIDILDFMIGAITIAGLICLVIYYYIYCEVISEKECINYYLNTGYILEECESYENLKK